MPPFPKNLPPRGPARHKTLRIRTSTLEALRFEQAAAELGHSTSAWARGVLRENAARILYATGKETAM